MEHKRRQLISQPGEHLLLPTTISGVSARLEAWLAFSGMGADDVLVTPLCSVPLPLYTGHIAPGRRRWDGVRPEAMWHPLMWLPVRMVTPRRLRTATGREWDETYPEWAVRVALELSESGPVRHEGREFVRLYNFAGQNFVRPTGPADANLLDLYDPFTGTWLDVLSTVGLDVDNAIDLARVEAWLEGEDDPALDSIDLERHLAAVGRDEDWAVDRTHRVLTEDDAPGRPGRTFVEDLRDASTALVAHELDGLAAHLATGNGTGLEDARQRLMGLVSVASSWTSLNDAEADDLALALDRVTIEAAAADDLDELREGPVQDFRGAMENLAHEKVTGIDRLSLRTEVEAIEVLNEIDQIHTGQGLRPDELIAARMDGRPVRPE